jgi:hypothetical protein
MRIIGVDPSMTATGLCAWDGTTSTVKTNAKQKDNRLRVIREAVARAAQVPDRVQWHSHHPVDLAVVELPPPGLKGPAIPAMHMVQGIVRVALMDAGVPYAIVNPQYVKAYAGWARNDKEAMARAAYETDGSVFADDNQCDSWWLRQMALDRYGMLKLGARRVTASQRAWLDKVQWPELETGVEL